MSQGSRANPMVSGNRLESVRLNGSGLSGSLIEACASAQVSASMSSVTELRFTFYDDHNLSLFRSGLFQDGHTVSFAHWRGRIKGGAKVKAAKGGPQIEVTAPSLFVEKLKAQTGARNWGSTLVTSWLRAQCESVGILHDIENWIGTHEISREKPDGDRAESTWDVMTATAKEMGCWIFEHSSRLIVGKPSWVATRPERSIAIIDLRWSAWSDYSPALLRLPEFTPGPRDEQRLKVRITGRNAHMTCPGDVVNLSGRLNGGTSELNANGRWVVSDVKIPLTVSDATELTCIRPTLEAF